VHLSQNHTFFFFAISGQRWGCGKKPNMENFGSLSSGSSMMTQAADVSTSKMAERPPNHRRWPFKAVGQCQKKICLRLACPPLPPLPCVPRQIPTYPLPRALKKIYYSNEKLVNWPSISLSVALQLFQCALHSLQTHFWLITNKFWIFSSFMRNNMWLAEDQGLQCFFKFKPVECQKCLFVTYIGILIYFRTSPTSCEPKMWYVFLGTAFFGLTYPF